jgi:hypothetical protein
MNKNPNNRRNNQNQNQNQNNKNKTKSVRLNNQTSNRNKNKLSALPSPNITQNVAKILSTPNIIIPTPIPTSNRVASVRNQMIQATTAAVNNKNQNIIRRVAAEDFIRNIFAFTSQLKLYHWQTRSYSRHVETNNYLMKLHELLDEFVETYMGKYPITVSNMQIELKQMNDDEIVDYVKNNVRKYFMDNINLLIGDKDPDLRNIRDEIVGHTNHLLYFYRFHNNSQNKRNSM